MEGRTIADTRAALTLREASYPPVLYVPRRDVDMALLVRTDHATYCPYKGDCSYYSIPAGGERSVNAVWTYETRSQLSARSRNISRSIRTGSTRSRNARPDLAWRGRVRLAGRRQCRSAGG